MTTDISFLVPTIRLGNLPKFMESLEKSCKKYTFELVFISPFDRPETLSKYNNIKWLKDLGTPSRCCQLGLFECTSQLLAHTVDDAIFFENAIDECIDLYNEECTRKDVVNCRYIEGPNFSGTKVPDAFWTAHFHHQLRLPGIPRDYKISLHHMLDLEYMIELGGWDCRFNHLNFNGHDLMFRIQHDGGRVYDSPNFVTNCNQFLADTVDHAPIFNSHNQHDLPLFQRMYSDPNVIEKRVKIDINNWANEPAVWDRRFGKGIPQNYEDIVKSNG